MPEFIDEIPEEYRDKVQDAGIGDMQTLVKNWADAQSALGSSLRIPSAEAGAEQLAEFDRKLAEKVPGVVRVPSEDDPEARSRFYQSLGRPEAADKYDIEITTEGLEEGQIRDMKQWVSQVAFEANLTQEQARGVANGVAEVMAAGTEAQQRKVQEAAEALRKEWGAGYEQRLEMARHALRTFGGEEGAQLAMQELDASGLGNHPALLKALSKVTENLAEDTFVAGMSKDALPATMSELKQQIADIRGNRDHPYHDRNHPGHQVAVDKMNTLYEQLHQLQGGAA